MRLDFGTFFLLLCLLIIAYRVLMSRKIPLPTLPISVQAVFEQKATWRVKLANFSSGLFWVSLVFLAIALSHPRQVQTDNNPERLLAKSPLPRRGIALYFLLDESGSMQEKVSTVDSRGRSVEIPKIDLAKSAIMEFIEGKAGLNLPGRKNDLIGLIAFARVPEVLCPLTLDRQAIAAKLKSVQPIIDDRRNGTAIGYAIFKAVNIIVATKYFAKRQEEAHKSVYSIANQAIIIITDGLQSPHPDDKENPFRFMPPDEAINYAKENGIRVFYIGIDPILSKSDFAADVRKMKKAMQDSGGELFLATAATPIEEILVQIDQMEKSEIAPEVVVKERPVIEVSLIWLFIALAMCTLAISCVLETTIARAAP